MKRGFSFLLVLLLGSVMLFSISLSEAENIALDDAGVKHLCTEGKHREKQQYNGNSNLPHLSDSSILD